MELPPGLVILPAVFTAAEAAAHLRGLSEEVDWEDHVFSIFGRTVPMPRRIQMYGPFGYRYSGVEHPPRPLLPRLEAIRRRVEARSGCAFNSVLCNLYRDGQDAVGWHTDDDYPHGGQPVIGSLSLGATRSFHLKLKKGKGSTVKIPLESGTLVLLAGEARTAWVHAVPRTALLVGPRINLTFRQMQGS